MSFDLFAERKLVQIIFCELKLVENSVWYYMNGWGWKRNIIFNLIRILYSSSAIHSYANRLKSLSMSSWKKGLLTFCEGFFVSRGKILKFSMAVVLSSDTVKIMKFVSLSHISVPTEFKNKETEIKIL